MDCCDDVGSWLFCCCLVIDVVCMMCWVGVL